MKTMTIEHTQQTDLAIDARRRHCVIAAAATAASAAGAALGLTACAGAASASVATRATDRTTPTIDMHSHAGRVIPSRTTGFDRPFIPFADQMRAGGMDVLCLAVVADTPVTRIEGGAVRAFREPEPGELHAWALRAFPRAQELAARERLHVVLDRAALAVAIDRPSVVIASEGADFLEGRIDRVDQFYETFGLRHLQLTHYRVNELGDIQTVPPVHGRLTDFGAHVVRRCNERGIVIDVAHAPMAMVRGVVDATTRPLVLSHTSLSPRPAPFSRLISPEHARLIAATGGVIGVWPPASRFPTLAALAAGIRDMVDAAGIDHVGLGTDMLGLTGPSIFDNYDRLPLLEHALGDAGFGPEDIAKVTGGNYARVFDACMTG